jgi:hypothetical protein
MAQKHNTSLYHAIHGMRRGRLHRAIHVPENESIPEAKLQAAKHSDNPSLVHMANFASTLKGFHKK